MEVDNPDVQNEKPKKKKKMKPMMKLKIPDSQPTDSGVGLTEEAKVGDSRSTGSSYHNVVVDKESIEIQDEMDKFAPQVHGNTVTFKKKFAEPAGTLESNADVSMTSNSL
jgi:hypothetical protein